jgi:tripartite-type tricarboxylate transporter receptor subunit TctC
MGKSLGQQFIIENRPGAESVLAAEYAARAEPDGYTLYFGSNEAFVANRVRLKSLPYDPDKDFTPVANVVDSASFVVAVRPEVPAKTFAELIAAAKANPGKLGIGVTIGQTDTLAQWINKIAGVDIQRVQYRQNPQAVQGILGDEIQVLLISLPSVEQFVTAENLRIVAVSGSRRFPGLPDTPTIAETYPGLIMESWFVLMAPAATPAHVVDLLNRSVEKVLKEPQVVDRINSFGFVTTTAMTSATLKDRIRDDVALWRKIASDINLEPR